MDFIAYDLDSVPILLAQALASDKEDWTVELYAPGQNPHNGADPFVTGHLLTNTDWDTCWIQPTVDDSPVGQEIRQIPWDDVGTIVVP